MVGEGERMLWVAEYVRARAVSVDSVRRYGGSLQDEDTMDSIIGGAVEEATCVVQELRDAMPKLAEGYGLKSDEYSFACEVVGVDGG